jgi:tetratricopeptide (TPR) repeat protein
MSVRRLTVAVVLPLLATAVFAQSPEPFTNLQFFPKDIARKDLMQTMRTFSFSLGVRCEFCHVQNAEKVSDFASDAKEEKRTARAMLAMVEQINRDTIAKLGKDAPIQVQCVTCHRALSRPQAIDALVADLIEKKDVAAAIARYEELRKTYYGSARYDFGETPMNQLSEALLSRNKNREAVAIMEMNVAFNEPASSWATSLLAKAHLAAGDTRKAKADFKKLLRVNPENAWAQEQLQKLKEAK